MIVSRGSRKHEEVALKKQPLYTYTRRPQCDKLSAKWHLVIPARFSNSVPVTAKKKFVFTLALLS